jgi:hypothetical protein
MRESILAKEGARGEGARALTEGERIRTGEVSEQRESPGSPGLEAVPSQEEAVEEGAAEVEELPEQQHVAPRPRAQHGW